MGEMMKSIPVLFWYILSICMLMLSTTVCWIAVRASSVKINYSEKAIEIIRSSEELHKEAERLGEITTSLIPYRTDISFSIAEPESIPMSDPETYDSDDSDDPDYYEGIGGSLGDANDDILDEMPEMVVSQPHTVERISPDVYKELEDIRNRSRVIQQNVQQSLKQ